MDATIDPATGPERRTAVFVDLGEKGIPTVVTGFVLPDDPFHAPNESFSLRGLELGYHSARELLIGLADLKSQ